MKKTVYIFLCMLLGAVLFLIIQRSALFLYYLLLNNSTGFDQAFASQLQIIDIASMLIFLILGLWYGSYLGRHWFTMIYEPASAGVPNRSDRLTVAASRAKSPSSPWDFDDLMNQSTGQAMPRSAQAAQNKPIPATKTVVKSTVKVAPRPKKVVRKRAAKPTV